MLRTWFGWLRCGLGWFGGGLGWFGVVWGVSTDRFISNKTIIFQGFRGGPTFFRGGGGPTFSRGEMLCRGRVVTDAVITCDPTPLLYIFGNKICLIKLHANLYRNPKNLWFSRGVRTPYPLLWIRTCTEESAQKWTSIYMFAFQE